MTRFSYLFLAGLVLAACGDTSSGVRAPPNLDRPVDIAFGCWGGLRIVGDNGVADVDDSVVEAAQPLESCSVHARGLIDPDCEGWICNKQDPDNNVALPTAPAGQEQLTDDGGVVVPGVEYFAFVLQSVPGTVALLHFPAKPPVSAKGPNAILTTDVNFVDADPLTPGRNSVPVGSLPVAIGTDRAGCHLVTANAGSCDLSVVDIESIADGRESTPPVVRAIDVVNATGQPIAARPAAMVAEPVEADQPIGVECPADPEGLFYVAYPDCHLVAAIRAATGTIEAGVLFHADGTFEITDGNVSCPAQCGGGGALTPGPHPSSIDLVYDPRVGTRRLAIGAEDSPVLAVVELDDLYHPLSASPVTLQGDVGVLDLAVSPQIGMGGSTGVFDDENTGGGQHQFVYAVTTDQTVRVADIFGVSVECDTQVDPRFLRLETNTSRLSCLPVGDPATPPRRPLARGPGIELVAGSVPTAVTIAPSRQYVRVDPPAPDALQGYFAFVTTASGEAVIVNIDDDAYRDIWLPSTPLVVQMPLAAAHQVRDAIVDRAARPLEDDGTTVVCTDEGIDESEGGPRTRNSSLALGYDPDEINQEKRYVLPTIERILCEGAGGPSAIMELSYQAPPDLRDRAFPDLRALRASETWSLTWEGPLSRDSGDQSVDGPVNRTALVAREGGDMAVRDPSRPFCTVGTEPGDLVVLTGCDPAQGDAQCGLDEVCYVHPQSEVGTGSCLPANDAEELAGICRDFLITMRKYAVRTTTSGELHVVPRRHMLTTSPVDGCTSDDQCMQLAQYEASLASASHPIDDTTTAPDRAYRCEPDVTRQGNLNRCMEVCTASDQCDAGTVCSGGYCIEAVLPPPECVPGVQRYQVRAGDAITVVGDLSGYLHPIIEDPTTGACVKDINASPLLIGRIPLTAPPCPGPDVYDVLTPNPCSTTVVQTEPVPNYIDDACTLDGPQPNILETRDAPAIRFKNPMMTFHLVDPWYPGDAVCREDRAGTLGMIPTVHNGYQYTFPVLAGFFTQRANTPSVLPVRTVRGPDGSVWVIDAGDDVPDELDQVTSTRGQVFRFEPSNLSLVNSVQ